MLSVLQIDGLPAADTEQIVAFLGDLNSANPLSKLPRITLTRATTTALAGEASYERVSIHADRFAAILTKPAGKVGTAELYFTHPSVAISVAAWALPRLIELGITEASAMLDAWHWPELGKALCRKLDAIAVSPWSTPYPVLDMVRTKELLEAVSDIHARTEGAASWGEDPRFHRALVEFCGSRSIDERKYFPIGGIDRQELIPMLSVAQAMGGDVLTRTGAKPTDITAFVHVPALDLFWRMYATLVQEGVRGGLRRQGESRALAGIPPCADARTFGLMALFRDVITSDQARQEFAAMNFDEARLHLVSLLHSRGVSAAQEVVTAVVGQTLRYS